MTVTFPCTSDCEATQICQRCNRRKAPRGRSVAPKMVGGLCDTDCPGYREEPRPGHLWPGELERLRVHGISPMDSTEDVAER